MADWTNPKLSSPYVNFLNDLNVKIVEAAAMNVTGTSIPTTAMRFERGNRVFQEWDGAQWITRPLGVLGGGTGGSNGNEARINLGFGTMAMQNSNGVSITGGAISGTNLDATYLTSGIIPDARFPDPLPARNGGNLHNLNAAALAFGQVPAAARLGTGATGAGLLFLADNLTWKSVSMAPRVAHVTLNMPALSNFGLVALPYTVQAEKSYIVPTSGLYRNFGSTGIGEQHCPVDTYFCNSGGTQITTGPATHIRGTSSLADGNQVNQNFKLEIVEWL